VLSKESGLAGARSPFFTPLFYICIMN